jgi:hypothetical protein
VVARLTVDPGWKRRFFSALFALTTPALFSACETGFSPPTGCPTAEKVTDSDRFTRFNGDSQRTEDIDFGARIYGVYTPKCIYQLTGVESTNGSYVAELQIEFQTRPKPDDLRERETTIGYRVVLVDASGNKVSQYDRKIRLLITPDRAWASKIDTPVIALPLADGESADGYRIYVSLDLTERDRAYNRRHPEQWP